MENQNQNEMEVIEQIEEQKLEPLRILVVFSDNTTLDLTVEDKVEDDYRNFILNSVDVTNKGVFLDNIFIPKTSIKYFQRL